MRRTICSLSLSSVVVLTCTIGSDASAAFGGPDLYGYTFLDQADGVTYNYVDITATGAVVASGDDEAGLVLLGVPFDVYYITYLQLTVTTNGFITDAEDAANDVSNDCPLPALPSTGSGFRLNALHDDLDTTVYYQYFDPLEADAIGFPGQPEGVSIFQWTGTHSGSAAAVDFEAVLFHEDDSILTMVATDDEAGDGSTLGMQDGTTDHGLTYACNTALSVEPGVTAVQYSLDDPPDSPCCAPSPSNTRGCQDTTCQTIVCAGDIFCCDTDWDGMCAAQAQIECPLICDGPPAITINEFRIDQPGVDTDEYFELVGPPGTLLNDIQYIVLGDVPTGEIEAVIDLSGEVIPPSGLLVVAESGFGLGAADVVTNVTFENTDTVTHMLVGGLSAYLSENIDDNADGTLDQTPWLAVLDTVSMIHPTSLELPYGPGSSCTAGPTCQEIDDGVSSPAHAFRCPNGIGPWVIGEADPALMGDSPGQLNPCPCGNGVIDPGETCDDAGESPTCDLDCTAAACGDGTSNTSAGEDCDGMGESAECDADCTFALCGDGQINGTAGETCDDGVQTATCDFDCTAAECGDGLLNPAAGEICDDAGETAQCDLDCTSALCGDGVVNPVAGEICDDMVASATCDEDCTPVLCGDGLANPAAGEDCDDIGETATCDDDCTIAECGDGLVNTTAGETCDDGGRSETCDDDCTTVSCGDGIVNMAAGEECDGDGMGGGGETDVCDDDCTNALCGDGAINATAGEECDDRGESAECDDDCTAPACGDGVLNASAGEECDDGNTDDDDGCASDCFEEEPAGSTGSTGDTGVDETAGPTDDSSGGPISTSSTGSETDTDTDGPGAVPGDEGCGCTTGPNESAPPWSVLALFGLGALGRRRRR